ncbi:MAG: TetM/TetW/TetO/TetS family tetracycline resistance ribosomal protection protein [Eubacteriaceae bacterium]|nr:TetM/TetW/TetO/TetS family tetracycline resistance ribosomal protection protein [Eubacteriaceae bacterium]
MRKITAGMIAHVDAGKTTLAEAMLFASGQIRKQGRVDHRDTTMDSHLLEKQRGITIFASQAYIPWEDTGIYLLDTPGHVDFSSETERIMRILDCAVLVISGTDGVQAHTVTLMEMLRHYMVPVFVFVTKMDYARKEREELLSDMRKKLGEGFVDILSEGSSEEAAMLDEELLEKYLSEGKLTDEDLRRLIGSLRLFPVYFGSGLKDSGINEFLSSLCALCPKKTYPDSFGARVFKISRDPQGSRLTHVKITGGTLRVKDSIETSPAKSEKVDQIRMYTGERFNTVSEASAGDVCVLTGLGSTYSGQGLGFEEDLSGNLMESVMEYRLRLPEGEDPVRAFRTLSVLSEEDPSLGLRYDSSLGEIRISIMGQVQTEILTSVISERFGMQCSFDMGRVLYRETIADTVEGIGHYEPLRHYAEVHLLMEPLPRGSGLVFADRCPDEVLERNWRNLVLTHLREKQHPGVLTGSPVTDMRISLVSGRSHLKHTEGGDFRQATYRAVRQGLMKAKSVLLEPWYSFTLTVPSETVGRAINDIRMRNAVFSSPEEESGMSVITGRAPLTCLSDYAREVSSYTSGRGKFSMQLWGYDECHDPDRVIEEAGYDPITDLENPTSSIFCANGGGFDVRWDRVEEYMHLESFLKTPSPGIPKVKQANLDLGEKELEAIIEREFGRSVHPFYRSRSTVSVSSARSSEVYEPVKKWYVIDGYNVIFAWDELRDLAQRDIAAAREKLIHIVSNFSAFSSVETVLVFDGYRVKGSSGEKSDYQGIHLVYTMENETADAYMQKLLSEMGKNDRVYVVTSDSLVQLSAMHSGALRRSAADFREEVENTNDEIRRILASQEKESFVIGEALENRDAAPKD